MGFSFRLSANIARGLGLVFCIEAWPHRTGLRLGLGSVRLGVPWLNRPAFLPLVFVPLMHVCSVVVAVCVCVCKTELGGLERDWDLRQGT